MLTVHGRRGIDLTRAAACQEVDVLTSHDGFCSSTRQGMTRKDSLNGD